jgi:hypothetical protein
LVNGKFKRILAVFICIFMLVGLVPNVAVERSYGQDTKRYFQYEYYDYWNYALVPIHNGNSGEIHPSNEFYLMNFLRNEVTRGTKIDYKTWADSENAKGSQDSFASNVSYLADGKTMHALYNTSSKYTMGSFENSYDDDNPPKRIRYHDGISASLQIVTIDRTKKTIKEKRGVVVLADGEVPDDGIKAHPTAGDWWYKKVGPSSVAPTLSLDKPAGTYPVKDVFNIRGTINDVDTKRPLAAAYRLEQINGVAPYNASEVVIFYTAENTPYMAVNYDLNLSTVPIGKYKLVIFGFDDWTYLSDKIEYTIDVDPAPTITSEKPAGTYQVAENWSVKGTVNDLALGRKLSVLYRLEQISGITPYAPSENVIMDTSSSMPNMPYSKDIDFSKVPMGQYKLKVWGRDQWNFDSNVITYTVDVHPAPTLTLELQENTPYTIANNLSVKGNFKDLDIDQGVGVKYSLCAENGTPIAGQEGIVVPDLKSNNIDHPFTYSFNANSLSVGNYKLKIWAEDSMKSKSAVKTISLQKVAPSVVSIQNEQLTQNSLQADVLAQKSGLELKPAPYKITVEKAGQVIQDINLQAGNITGGYQVKVGGLTPNQKYDIKAKVFDVKDISGAAERSLYTLAEIPSLTSQMDRSGKATVTMKDNNPSHTEYKYFVNNTPVNNLGKLSSSTQGDWVTLGAGRTFEITGLNPGLKYNIEVMARNGDQRETLKSEIHVTTPALDKPVKVSKINVTVTSKDAAFEWQAVKDATSYKVKLFVGDQAVGAEQTVYDTKLNIKDLAVDTKYKVQVIAQNDAGISEAHVEFFQTKSIEFQAPKMLKESCKATNYSTTVVWEALSKSFGYEVEADGEIYAVGKETTFTHKNLTPNSRHIYRVRTLNQKGVSAWSEKMVLMTSKSGIVGKIEGGKVFPTHESVVIQWQPVKDASKYLVSFNGGAFVDGGNSLFCIRSGLKSDTQYDYVVKAVNDYGQGAATMEGTVKTMLLSTPEIDHVEEVTDGYKLIWKPVLGAEYYLVKKNDVDLGIKPTTNQFEIKDLKPKELSTYSVSAVSSKGSSAWSDVIHVEGTVKAPQKPAQVSVYGYCNHAVLTWEEAEKSSDIGYEIEVDGVVVEPIETLKYTHKSLKAFSEHTYRVRAKNDFAYSDWTTLLSVKTLPGLPKAPDTITISNSTNFATLKWDAVESATGYEVAIKDKDGNYNVVKLGNINFYRQKSVKSVEQTYKVRAINLAGTGEWSNTIVNNAIKAICEPEKPIELGLTASQVSDFDQYLLQVTYNPGVLTAEDLCGYTILPELAAGKVQGTDIEIVAYEPGKIVFKVKKAVENGYSWTGIINNIKFKAKLGGASYINYTVFIDEQPKDNSDKAKKKQ